MLPEPAIDVIADVAERLRRLPAVRWAQPPLAPLGSRPPNLTPERTGDSLEVLVREAIRELMHADATTRGGAEFEPEVGVFSLADVLQALAISVASGDDEAALRVLDDVAQRASAW